MQVAVDFRIETRDLFRVNLGLTRLRIFLGAAISLLMISALVIFFLMLDEEKVLLQTSPLFIGFPLLAVGGQILRLHAVCRKYVRSLSESQRTVRYVFDDLADGMEITSGKSSSHIAWSDVWKVVEKSKYFLIFVTKFEMISIPKAAFASSQQVKDLRHVLTAVLAAPRHLVVLKSD